MLAIENLGESRDGILERHELARETSEYLGHSEGLGKESLDLTGTSDSEFILLRKLIHTKDSNDILKILLILKHLLDTTSYVVVVVTDNAGVKHTAGGIEGIHSRVDTQLSNLTRKHSCSVKMGEGGGRGGIGKIISGHVDGLHGSDGTLLGGGDTLLESTKIGGKSGLVTDSGRNTSEKGRHLRVSLGETEDVVYEKKHILSLLITEVLGNSETGKSDTGTSSWGLVHLTVHKSGLRLISVQLNHTRLNHFVVEIVTLTSTLSDTSEDRVTTMSLSNVVDKFHDKHCLTDTGTTEETNLTTLSVGGKKIYDLDTSDKDFLLCRLVGEKRRVVMNGVLCLGSDFSTLINGLSNDVNDTAKGLLAYGNLDGGAGVNYALATDKTVSGIHSNSPHGVFSKMLGNLKNESHVVVLNLKGVQDGGELTIELNIDDGTNNLRYTARGAGGGGGLCSIVPLLCDPIRKKKQKKIHTFTRFGKHK
mmetsp:Transcript_19812/g.50669  ORF Transcript_19812/g.50669 Transcript_19812/m.50669 type:complete len:478 (-) Transcript_19812:230-1663(-)